MSLADFEKRAAELAAEVEKAFANLKVVQGQHLELNNVIQTLRNGSADVAKVAEVLHATGIEHVAEVVDGVLNAADAVLEPGHNAA